MHHRSTSLVDILAQKAGCLMLSDLRYLSIKMRKQLAREVLSIQVEDFSLWEWNDALCYIVNASQARSSVDARTQLIKYLDPSQKTE